MITHMSRALIAIFIGSAACHTTAPPPLRGTNPGGTNLGASTVAPTEPNLNLWRASVDAAPHRDRLILHWRGAFEDRHKRTLYMLYDQHGWRGVARVGDRAPDDCDDCETRAVAATLIAGPGCGVASTARLSYPVVCEAVGPVSDADAAAAAEANSPWRRVTYRARDPEVYGKPRPATYVDPSQAQQWTASLDLGLPNGDVEYRVEKCGQWKASGCAGRVCSEHCLATVRAPAAASLGPLFRDPSPSAVTCHNFVPDLEDCNPLQPLGVQPSSN